MTFDRYEWQKQPLVKTCSFTKWWEAEGIYNESLYDIQKYQAKIIWDVAQASCEERLNKDKK